MKENDKYRKVILTSILIAIITMTLGTTIAFFITQAGRNEEQKLTIQTGNLALTFEDNDSGLTGNIMIGESREKLFIIRNTGTQPVTTNMIWENLVNTYLEESLSYTLEYKTSEDGIYQSLETAHENVPQSDKADDYNLANNITIPAGSTYYYKLTIIFNNLPDVNQEADKTAILSTKFNLGDEVVENGPAVKLLLNKINSEKIINYNEGNIKEMYTFNHEATDQTLALTDYRYIGTNPNNYIKFNNEIWRIIGIFTIEKSRLIKVMRNSSIGSLPYDSSSRKNDWNISTLQNMLNNDYFNNEKFIYNYTPLGGTQKSLSITGINQIAQTQISNAIWYIGGFDSSVNGQNYYNLERHNIPSKGSNIINLKKYVGLIYPSDYVYTFANNVDQKCFTNPGFCRTNNNGNPTKSWMWIGPMNRSKSWMISAHQNGDQVAFFVQEDGSVYSGGGVHADREVIPTVYLRSDIKIIDGDGSESSPYQIQ